MEGHLQRAAQLVGHPLTSQSNRIQDDLTEGCRDMLIEKPLYIGSQSSTFPY